MAESHFDDWVAERYEQLWPHLFAPDLVESTLDCLCELATGGACLEFGIGTGRIGIPLSQRDVRVHGIELSQSMVRRLRVQPGGGDLAVTIGDFATTSVGGEFSLVYLLRTVSPGRRDGALRKLSSPHRYVWPHELDLMAKLAWLTLRHRWSDWQRNAFTSDSSSHISVRRKPSEPS